MFGIVLYDVRTVLGTCSNKFWANVGTMLYNFGEKNDNICEGLS